jgi:hypothetical protein
MVCMSLGWRISAWQALGEVRSCSSLSNTRPKTSALHRAHDLLYQTHLEPTCVNASTIICSKTRTAVIPSVNLLAELQSPHLATLRENISYINKLRSVKRLPGPGHYCIGFILRVDISIRTRFVMPPSKCTLGSYPECLRAMCLKLPPNREISGPPYRSPCLIRDSGSVSRCDLARLAPNTLDHRR